MDKASRVTVTEADLLEAVTEALATPNDPTGALTCPELAEALGVSLHRARDVVRRLLRDGQAERVPKIKTAIDGRQCRVIGFRMVA